MAFKRTYRKKNYRRKRYTQKSTAAKALSLARKVYRVAKPEVKYFDCERPLYSVLGSGTRWSIFGTNSTLFQTGQDIVQGTGDDHRVGDKIRSKFLHLKYQVVLPNSAAVGWAAVRFMLVRWRRPNTGSLNVSDVYFDLASNPMIARRNIDKPGMFTVLYDKVHKMTKNQPNQNQFHSKFIRLNDEVQFDASSQFINHNAYFLIAYSDQAVVGNAPIMNFLIRYGFSDA